MNKSNSVLYLTTNDIEDPVRGCDRRSAQLCSNLPSEWHVDSISYSKSTPTASSDGAKIRSKQNERHIVFGYPRSSAIAPFDPRIFYKIRQLDQEYDIIVASAIGSVLYGLIASLLYNATFVVDLHNVDHRLSLAIGDYPRFLFATIFGILALRRADIVVLTSDEDAQRFSSPIRQKSVIMANGFDSDVFYSDGSKTENRVLFFGNMSYEPNQEAVEVIADTIAPSLAEARPETIIHVAGPNCDNIAEVVEDNNNIKLVGLVDNISSYVRESKVVIVPLKTGSGTRLKIIESLACGTPVISTPKGAEGWPDDWKNLTRVPIRQFSDVINANLSDGKFDHSEYDDVLNYSWSEQVDNVTTRIKQELE